MGCTASFCVWPSFERLQHCEYKSSRHGIENNRTCRENTTILENLSLAWSHDLSIERHAYPNRESLICGLANICLTLRLVWSHVKVTRSSQRKRLVERETLGPGLLEVEEVEGQVQVWVPPLKLQIITGLAERIKRKSQWDNDKWQFPPGCESPRGVRCTSYVRHRTFAIRSHLTVLTDSFSSFRRTASS